MTMTTPVSTEPHILGIDLVRIFTAKGVEVQALQGLNLRVERGEMVERRREQAIAVRAGGGDR